MGGSARATHLAKYFGCDFAIIQKKRPRPNVVEIMKIIGDVKGKVCVMIDDMVDTGGSIVQGAEALKEAGAKAVYVIFTHPVLSNGAVERLEKSPIARAFCMDTIPVPPEKRVANLIVVDSAPLLARAIRAHRMHGSVSQLFADWRV